MSILSEMVAEGFVRVGRLTARRPESKKLRKHGIYFEGEAPKSRGVYILVEGLEIVKVGETRGENGLQNRIDCYLFNSGKTNERIRHALREGTGIFDVYFFAVPEEKVEFAGMKVIRSLAPHSLEKELLLKIERRMGEKPRLNPVSK